MTTRVPQRVIFDHVITNEGSGYNVSTGVFTAPFNGTYFFILTVAQKKINDTAELIIYPLAGDCSYSVTCSCVEEVHYVQPFDVLSSTGWLVVVLLLLCTEISSFQWTSDIQDGADVYACVNESVTFPWRYAVDRGEVVEDIKWYFQSQTSSHVGIAGTVQGQFFPLPTPFSNRIRQVEEAGLQLMSPTTRDRGSYSVTVTVLRGLSFATYNRTAFLIMAETPLIHHSEALWAQQERATVYDNNTGQLHVQLSCGKYVTTGNPPVSVEWKFPSGETQLVSTHINGKFFLTLPNPVEGGNYTCRLSSRFPPVSCLPRNSSVFASSSVTVDEVKIRLSLLEGEQEMNKIEKQDLREEVDRLKEENQKLREIANNLQRYNREENMKVRFDARLGTAKGFSTNQIIIFDLMMANEGNAYNATTGVFTAPLNGLYLFELTLDQYSSSRLPSWSKVIQSDHNFCQVDLQAFNNIVKSCESTVYLSQGEQLWVTMQSNYGYSFSLIAMYCSFVGFSINLDIPTET
ncbi:uncharacterized protein LOC112555570 [Pomacea canaliculata]|uniref:uncharacterized protein LOC112555570 n=1 Tax=Pomacea canaliculata TaxID=400727 RepID=UPI000D7281D2|nr:uncharacterized protein LOC112555570 [Pomacea canaliculata]